MRILLLSDNLDFANDLKEQIVLNLSDTEVFLKDNGEIFDIVAIDGKHPYKGDAPVYKINKPLKLVVLLDDLASFVSKFESSEQGFLKFSNFELRPASKEIISLKSKTVLKLTEKEVNIIKYLYKARERVVPKTELLKEVWGYNEGATTHTIETHIYRLRQKIEKDCEVIETTDGGYRLMM